MTSLLAHFEGCLLGGMIGDGLGSLVENASTGLVAHRYPTFGDLAALEPGAYGSTTEMTAALGESLAAIPEFDGEDFARRLVASAHDVRGYGQGTMLALSRLKAGVSWQEAGAGQAGRSCYGNAAAARSAPVGLVHRNDTQTLRWIAEEAAGVTHTHALAVEGAVVFALAVAYALEARDEEFSAQDFFETIATEVQVREYRSHLEMAASFLGRDAQPSVVADRLGNNQTALGSVVTALLCFADHADNFADAAARALRHGGNASAITAMTLSLSGAYLGVDEIPARWIEALEVKEVSAASMRNLARRLASI